MKCAIRKVVICASVFWALMLSATFSFGFKLVPVATPMEQKLPKYQATLDQMLARITTRGIGHFTFSVHQQITNRIYNCDADLDSQDCLYPGKTWAPNSVLAGVEWNDNPPYQLSQSSGFPECVGETLRLPARKVQCWAKVFKDAETKAKQNVRFDDASGHALIYRVHFGDLQFLHSMASKDNETADATRQRILMWAEFTYRFALGDFPVDAELRHIGISGMEVIFASKGWTPSQLFTLGDPTYRNEIDLRTFAFGSFLHVVEDSFANGHVDRNEPTGGKCQGAGDMLQTGQIQQFRSYTHQNPDKHGAEDSPQAFNRNFLIQKPTVVDVGRMIRKHLDARAPWDEVRPYVECIFAIAPNAVDSGPGNNFE